MSIHLLETVQQNLGYPALQKIDPNTQQMVVDASTPNEDKFSQAAIPAVLISLYKYAQSDLGAKNILKQKEAYNWVNEIFGDNKNKAIEAISSYSKQSGENPIEKLNAIGDEAIKITHQTLANESSIEAVKVFFDDQKNNILLYLPAALNFGEILHNNSLDDATNKMEGPISSLMQGIGSMFSNPTLTDDVKSSS